MASGCPRSLHVFNVGTDQLSTIRCDCFAKLPRPQVSAVIFSCSSSAFLRQVRHEEECRGGTLESLVIPAESDSRHFYYLSQG